MKYPRLVSYLAFRTNTTYEQVDSILKGFAEAVKTEVLENEGEVRVPGFGKFWPRRIKSKEERVIGGMTVSIPEQVKVAFKAFQGSGKEVD